MAAKQSITVTKTANNPNAKYRIHFIKYIYNGQPQTKVIITRKNNEPTNEKNQSVI